MSIRYCVTGKISFSEDGVARQVAKWQRRKPERGYIRAYECPFCAWWHLTSKKPRVAS